MKPIAASIRLMNSPKKLFAVSDVKINDSKTKARKHAIRLGNADTHKVLVTCGR